MFTLDLGCVRCFLSISYVPSSENYQLLTSTFDWRWHILKYLIGATFWKLSTTCIKLWLASAYRLLAGGGLWPPGAWRIFTRFNASSFFTNSKNFRMLGDTQLLLLGNSNVILECNSLLSVVRRMLCRTYSRDWLKKAELSEEHSFYTDQYSSPQNSQEGRHSFRWKPSSDDLQVRQSILQHCPEEQTQALVSYGRRWWNSLHLYIFPATQLVEFFFRNLLKGDRNNPSFQYQGSLQE